jgi:hypothetical protein
MKHLSTVFAVIALCLSSSLIAQNIAETATVSEVPSTMAEVLPLLSQDWKKVETLNKEGLSLPMDMTANEHFIIKDNNTMVALYKDEQGAGNWKYDPINQLLFIGDQITKQTVTYKIMELSQDKLVLFYANELSGDRTLRFVSAE